jgi:hypothetical protein
VAGDIVSDTGDCCLYVESVDILAKDVVSSVMTAFADITVNTPVSFPSGFMPL